MPDTETALAHFIRGRGKDYLEFKSLQSRSLKMAGVSFVTILFIPGMIMLSAVLSKPYSFAIQLTAESAAILIGGVLISFFTRGQVQRTVRGAVGERTNPITLSNGVEVSPQAQEMVMKILMSYQRQDPNYAQNLKRVEALGKNKFKAAFSGVNAILAIQAESASQLASLPQTITDDMELAADQFQRCMDLSIRAPQSANAISVAADEAMVIVLDGALRVAKGSASAAEVEPRLAATGAALVHLAENLEALTAQTGFTPTAGIQDLVDETRAKLPTP